MRLLELSIEGFGEAHDRRVGPLRPNVTVFLGPNEAGKTTLHEFVRTVLLGFPRTWRSHYVPAYKARHGGSILFKTDDGRTFKVTRTAAANGGDLRIEEGGKEVANPGKLLGEITGHVSPATFRSIFAFGLDELHEVGSIDDDRVNKHIYSAGLGVKNLPEALRRIEERRDAIFTPRAPTRPIAAMSAEISEIDDKLGEWRALVVEYSQFVDEEAEATKQLEDVNGQNRELAKGRAELDVLIAGFPMCFEIRGLTDRLNSLPVCATPDAVALARIDELERRALSVEPLLSQATAEAKSLPDAPMTGDQLVLADATLIEELRRGRQNYESLCGEAAKLESRLAPMRRKLDTLIDSVGAGWTEPRLREASRTLPAREAVHVFRERLSRASLELEQLERSAGEVTRASKAATQRLEDFQAVVPGSDREQVRQALSMKNSLGVFTRRFRDLSTDADRSARELKAACRLRDEAIERLGHVAVAAACTPDEAREILRRDPPTEQLNMFRLRMRDLQEEVERAATNLQTAEKNADSLQVEVDEIDRSQASMPAPAMSDEQRRSGRADLGEVRDLLGSLRRISLQPAAARPAPQPTILVQGLSRWRGVLAVGSSSCAVASVLIFHGATRWLLMALFATITILALILLRGKRATALPQTVDSDEEAQFQRRLASLRARLQLRVGDDAEVDEAVAAIEADERRSAVLLRVESQRNEVERSRLAARSSQDSARARLTRAEETLRAAENEWKMWLAARDLNPEATPHDLLDILAALGRFRSVDRERLAIEADVETLQRRSVEIDSSIEAERAAWLVCLGQAGLPASLSAADVDTLFDRLSAFTQVDIEVSRLQEMVLKQTTELEQKRHAYTLLEQEWQTWLKSTSVGGDLSPETASMIVDTLERGGALVSELDEMEERQKRIQYERDRYGSRVLEVASRHRIGSGEGSSDPPVVIAEQLFALLDGANRRSAVFEQQRAQSVLLRARIDEHATELQSTEEEIGLLLRSAGVASADELRRQAKACAERDEVTRRRDELWTKLSEIVGTIGAAERLAERLATVSRQQMQQSQQALAASAERLSEQRDSLIERRSNLQGRLRSIESADRTVDLLSERGLKLEELKSAVNEWLRLALAAQLLRDTQSRYEQERKPEVVVYAEAFMERITDGAYRHLHAPVGSSELKIVRTSDQATLTPSQLSRGTREQLYLALRLGLIRSFHDATGAALPVLVDEIFVNFDAARSRHVARAFIDLSSTHQVLVFTCHEWVAELFLSDASQRVTVMNL